MQTLNEYANLVLSHRDQPHYLADLQIEISVKYAYLAELYKPIRLKRAEFWQQKYQSEKPKSDTYLKTQWEATKEGQEELRLKIELDSLKNLMSAIKTYIVQCATEQKHNI